jgi:sugar phosphate permease
VWGYGTLEAGVRLLPIAGTMAVVAPSSARLVQRLGARTVIVSGMVLVAVGLLAFSTFSLDTSYGFAAVVMVVMSAGMAMVMPPATDLIMGSLPPAKAGVGSAVNDTTRELGGALGVAVLGSVVSSIYASHQASALRTVPVPEPVRAAASDSLGAALAVAAQVGGAGGAALATAARNAFLDGMGTTMLIAAGVAAVGAGLALLVPPKARLAELAALDAVGPPLESVEEPNPAAPADSPPVLVPSLQRALDPA